MDNPETPYTTSGSFEDPAIPSPSSSPSKMPLPPLSPRLPSPPPPTEIQIGPKSPALGPPGPEQSIIDANAFRRIHPGTKSANMAAGPPLVPLNELDSAFQLQEHLKALHYHHTRSPDSSSRTVPITRTSALTIATPPDGLDRTLWLYELCRFLINKCNDLIIGFLFDNPPCSALTCPEMRASEWQFLCAVHEAPKNCCAIDYCCHTLDWATNIVTSQKIFPSRLSLSGGGGAGGEVGEGDGSKGAGVKHLINIFRRLHRIFAHAWFQHRGVFWQVEGNTGLYVLFKTVCDVYELLPAENYKLPPEAEGLEPSPEENEKLENENWNVKAPTSILKPEPLGGNNGGMDEEMFSVGRTNTRRHIRQTPSVGSAVTTVMESDEEYPDVTQRFSDLGITEEGGDSNVPAGVESAHEEQQQQPEIGGQEMRRESVIHDHEAPAPSSVTLEEQASSEQTPISSNSSWDGEPLTPEGSITTEPVETVVEDNIPKHTETREHLPDAEAAPSQPEEVKEEDDLSDEKEPEN